MPKNLSSEAVESFRSRLCAIAERRFAEHGVEGVSIRQLAEELGCSAMTPYRYFRDKNEILAATRAAAFDRFAAELEAAHRGPGDAMERARAVGDAYLAFALREPNAYRLMFDLAQPGEAEFPDLVRAGARARRTMTAHLEELAAAGLLAGDPQLLGHVYWAAKHGVVALHLAGKLAGPLDFRAVHDMLMRLLDLGSRAATTEPSETRSASR